MKSTSAVTCLVLCIMLAAAGCEPPQAPASHRRTAPAQIMPLKEIKVGMRGYGMTVFHGDKIEPFPVEVISVAYDADVDLNGSTPTHGIIWIRCPDARMQVSGPVQGMSGSPIYLWDKDEPNYVGRGGRLIGAFALGYPLSKDCLVGVQPIEYMRQIAERAKAQPSDKPDAVSNQASPQGAQSLVRLLNTAQTRGIGERHTWRAQAIRQLLGEMADESSPRRSPPGPDGASGDVRPLMLPIEVGSSALADALTPLLQPHGLAPMASPAGATTGIAPPGIDIEKLDFTPGSVLAIPLVWGDATASAAGTVTEVLDDGTVLGFGHAMNANGTASVPIATGFVHTVMPMVSISFKLSGSGVIKGALVRDENAGVVGTPDGTFTAAPVNVTVNMPHQPSRTYDYQVVHQKQYTPIFAAVVAVQSLVGFQNPPVEHTLAMKADMHFQNGMKLTLDNLMPGSDPFSVLLTLLPPMATMAGNNHESTLIDRMDVTMSVENGLRMGTFFQGRLDKAELAPGDTLGIAVKIQPYGKAPFEKRIELPIPADLEDGQYQLIVADARTYVQMMFAARPHLLITSNLSELREALERILSVQDDALYVMLQIPTEGLAIGQEELPRLPSSRKAMIASPVSTLVTPYRDAIEQIVPMDLVPFGQQQFMIQVDHTLAQ